MNIQYCQSLRLSHVKIRDEIDSVIWSKNPIGGSYSPKLGYKALREVDTPNVQA